MPPKPRPSLSPFSPLSRPPPPRQPLTAAQIHDSLCHSPNSQLSTQKKVPSNPRLDANLASRFPLRLLFAEDNLINQKVGLTILHKLGYHADVAGNGQEVPNALQTKPYDLILLDVHMPEMDGLEASRRICERWPPDKRPRIVAMTGNALLGDREKCLEAGIEDYITKPVRPG